MKPRISALLLALLIALLLAQPASAHAVLVRSTPAAGALLDVSPSSVIMEFSEDLDSSFSQVQLFDSNNQLVEPGPGEVDPAAPRTLRLIVPDLPKGSYTAIWRVRSAADGHITNGNLPFGVGVAVTSTALIPPPGAPDPATLPPPALDTIARWLNLLAALFALGGIPFGLLVWRPAFRAATKHAELLATAESGTYASSDDAMTKFLRRLTLIGGALFLLTNLFFLLTQAAAAANVSLLQAIGAPLVQLLGGRSGTLWLLRLALIAQLIVLARRVPPAGRGPTRLWWVMLTIGAATLLTISMTSHAAASEAAALAIPLDWLHVAAMVAWLGGLPPLIFAVQQARNGNPALPLRWLVPRFSWLSAPCVAVLILTGIYSAYLHVGRLDLLPVTTYGRALLVKLLLVGALLLLGALNLLVLSRRLRKADQQTAAEAPQRLARALGRSTRAELTIGVALLLLVGVMTSVAPSLAAWQAHEQQGIAQSATVGDVDLTLLIAPAKVGDNEFAVDVTDRRPGAASAATRVLLRFDMEGMNMSALQAEAQPSGTTRYLARGNYTSMGGRWQIEVVLRRAGFDDVRHTFEMDIVSDAPFVITP